MATAAQRNSEPVIHAPVSRELRDEFAAMARRNQRTLAGETRFALERRVKSAATAGSDQRV